MMVLEEPTSCEPVDHMSALHIPCPNCQKELKVKDPALLGRKVKCPSCGHRFVLQWGESSQPSAPPRRAKAAAATAPATKATAAQAAALPEESLPTFEVPAQDPVTRLRDMQQRRRRRRNRNLLFAGIGIALLAGGYFLARPYLPPPAPQQSEPAAPHAATAVPPTAGAAPPAGTAWAAAPE